MSRSIKVALEYIPTVKLALKRHGFPSQKALAQEMGISRSTTDKFFTGKAVDYTYFVEISQILGLDWQTIASIEENPLPSQTRRKADDHQTKEGRNESLDIDSLVQKVRHHYHDKIVSLYGKMQLLDISQPVDVDNFYVEVNILEQITSQRWLEISDLLQDFNPATDDFDRLGLGKVRQKRVPGLEVVRKYSKLMVLGKPGSGKTTFLQHLAIQCIEDKFQAEQVPIFIRLKSFARYARNEGDFSLLNYISREFRSCGISNRDLIELVLDRGRGMILLDGLDEVPDEDEYGVIEQIVQFVEYYFKNQFIITCRIAASKYRFPGFTDVEVADFNDAQIKCFVEKWLVAFADNNPEQGLAFANHFIEKLNLQENQQIRELAVTPILLHLTCLVFRAKAEFPSNRAKLYEQGVDILLKRWDETRGIQRDEVYPYLDAEHKKELLSQLAAITFEGGDYFFEKFKIQLFIADFIRTLPNTKTEASTLQSDSEALLKAIEMQHGLLVERARGIYSFSHLTFQEYFTAREIVASSHPQALEQLVSHITTKRWREVFLLAAGMLQKAERLLQLMKQQVDGLIAADKKLQHFLMWVNNKSLSLEIPYKPEAVRACYFALDPALVHALVRAFDRTLDPVVDPALYFALGLALDRTLDPALDPALARALTRALARALNPALDPALDRALDHTLDPGLRQALQQLKAQLPNPNCDWEIFKQWWQDNGQVWIRELRKITISHRNMDRKWYFSNEQKKGLQQYYDANLLLVDCLKSGCNVSPAVRQEIEETLFLPIAEIEKRRSWFDR